ncbi:MAG: hypothetical protein K1000chlam2_01552 [Chlamydiae bacterium]|nr:hypothetical protein [Chlamydiota bacterium]
MLVNCCDRVAFGIAALSTGIVTAASYGAVLLSNQASDLCHTYQTEGLGILEHYISTEIKTRIQTTCFFTAQSSSYLPIIGTIAAITTLYSVCRMLAPPYRK